MLGKKSKTHLKRCLLLGILFVIHLLFINVLTSHKTEHRLTFHSLTEVQTQELFARIATTLDVVALIPSEGKICNLKLLSALF